ncbi:tyrosine-type recombinase/integrase [Vibrio parahaemolyticus]
MKRLKAQVRVEVIRKLECYQPTTTYDDGEVTVMKAHDGPEFWAKKSSSLFNDFSYHYPVVLDPDGSLWGQANRYLLSRVSQVTPPSHRTLESIANDLACFRRWMLDEEVDFLAIPKRMRARPTYRYCAYLHDLVRFQTIRPNTAKRRMSTVQNFYRWLELDGVEFPYALWIESDSHLSFKDSRGLQYRKQVKSTDPTRSFRAKRQSSDYDEYLEDGGKLRPLPKDQQIALVEALQCIGNTEMTLAFLLALTTGARLQTVFTFREQHIADIPRDGTTAKRIKVGYGTSVNTKYGKQMVLLVPIWLYNQLQIYSRSPRRMGRIARSPHAYPKSEDQYLFLTRAGKPYYMATNDPFEFLYRTPPRGNAVTQFIHQQLLPELNHQGHDFSIRFHDLRASFGMNLVESLLESFKLKDAPDERQPEFFQALMYVRERMGHNSLTTTEGYLNYRKKFKVASHIQNEFEEFLKTLINGEKNGLDT